MTEDYKAEPRWHGGRIIVCRYERNEFGISQEFERGKGPMNAGGDFPLDFVRSEKVAIESARCHSRARGNAPIFLQLAPE